MKLQILVPQYNETDDDVRILLSSIYTQQGIDLGSNIEVLIGNDGSITKLSRAILDSFSYHVHYSQFEHSGMAGGRKKLFEMATADYVMFCDADDMFLSNLALYKIFSFMEEGYDAIICDFLEERRDEAGRVQFIPHKRDGSFVHGKVYRRQFLLDNGVVWYPGFEYHEDSSYNLLAVHLAKKIKLCDEPLYLWKWRDGSVSRQTLFHMKTFTRVIYSNEYLLRDLLARGEIVAAKIYACMLMYYTYFSLNASIWHEVQNAQYLYDTEKCFQDWFRKYHDLAFNMPIQAEKQIIETTREKAVKRGLVIERITFQDWIKHIEELE